MAEKVIKAAKPAESRSVLSSARAKVGATVQSAGEFIARGGNKVSAAASQEKVSANSAIAMSKLKAEVDKTVATVAAGFGADKRAQQKRRDAAAAENNVIFQGLRATAASTVGAVAGAVSATGNVIAKKGQQIKGARTEVKGHIEAEPGSATVRRDLGPMVLPGETFEQWKARATPGTGQATPKVVSDLAKVKLGTEAAPSIADRVAAKFNASKPAMNKPAPITDDNNDPGTPPPAGRARGFQNAKNQAAAQRAKGNKYTGPTE